MRTRAPARRPVATWPAQLLAVALVALAVVAVRDAAVSAGWTTGPSWTEQLLEGVDGRTPDAASTAIGFGLVLFGLLLLLTSLRPARRTHLATPAADADVWISRRAVSRLAEDAAERVPGVESVTARTRRRLVVKVSATEDSTEQGVRDIVEQAVGGYLSKPVKIVTRKATP